MIISRRIFALLALTSLALYCTGSGNKAATAISQQQQSKQQQLGEPTSSNGVLIAQSEPFYGSNSDYASSSLMAENLINLGQQQSLAGGLYSKRARKMSAFMPMRGRKDGRDQLTSENLEQFYATTNANPQSSSELILVPNELGVSFKVDGNEQSGSDLVARLIAENRAGADWAAPRQFSNQLAARHILLTAPEVYESQPTGSGVGGNMMQAKLRRAFHPMRGKRTSSSALFVPEVNYSEDMQTD